MANQFLDELHWRGLLHQVTSDALGGHCETLGRLAYAGFDPTSDSLTVGNYVPMKLLAHWQRAGHRPVVLTGGGTGMIGDPSGKSAERQLLTPDEVQHNIDCQRRIFARVIDFDARGAGAAIMVDNADWLLKLGYIDVLREVGKHFSVNQMIARDSVATRLKEREQGISYTEFSYMVLQAYDFLHLYRELGCTVQLGGADQWGNIVSGIDLIRRCAGAEAFGVTNPLVTKSDGTKFGKTESGAIWLTADRTSPYRFHQFWLQTADGDVGRFLRWFTFLDSARVLELEASAAAKPEARECQRALADHLTEIFHGPTELARAQAAGNALFSGEVCQLDAEQLAEITLDLPQALVTPAEVSGDGALVLDLLVRSGLSASKREAREFLTNGSILLNGERVGADARLTSAQLLAGKYALVRRGKRQWGAIIVASA
ncbi:MAG: tyrosine--tRNA ligase [Phycisphaerales bacterium]|nr:tyrosine--tRNA ligase [Phycisphaerales bacterium]